MIRKDKIEQLIEDKLSDSDYFVVSLDVSTNNQIKLVIDSMKGITIDECVQFSRAIEHNLDRDVEDFELEVTSPGLHLPLKVREQYVKNINRELEILINENNEKITGKLLKVNENNIIVLEQKRKKIEGHKKKQLVQTEHTIQFNTISKALVKIKF